MYSTVEAVPSGRSRENPLSSRRTTQIPALSEGASFQENAEEVLSDLQAALAAVVGAAPADEGAIRRAVDLQRALGIDAPLAWRVFKVARADDPLLAAHHIPTRGQMETFLEAARRSGIAAKLLERARNAVDAYEEFRREHAGDRAALASMIAALRPSAASQIDEGTRRAAFKQNARIWGLQAIAAARAFILYPGREPGTLMGAAVAGVVGLHAVRPDVPLVVHAVARYDGTGRERGADGRPSHVYSAEDRSGLLMEFGTPGVEFRTEVSDDQTLTTRACIPGIGRRAAVTTFSLSLAGEATRELGTATLNHGTLTPVELCHLDLLIPSGLSDPRTARMAAYGRRTNVDRVFECRAADLLPIHEAVAHIGNVRQVPPAPGIPRWPEVIEHVLAEVRGMSGGDGGMDGRYDIYRCRVAYPVLHTLVSIRVDAVSD